MAKWVKEIHRWDTQIPKKNIKRCSTSVVMEEIKINITSIILQKLEGQIILIIGKDIGNCDLLHMAGGSIN